MTEENEESPQEADGYTIFAESYARWSMKPPVQGLRNLLKDEYPDESQLQRDVLALTFLQFEVVRWLLQEQPDDGNSGKEPWEQ